MEGNRKGKEGKGGRGEMGLWLYPITPVSRRAFCLTLVAWTCHLKAV
jgi:hypothetical protein